MTRVAVGFVSLRTVELVGELREEDVPPAVEQHLLDAFRDWKRDE